MTVRVKFFATYRRLFGVKETAVELPEGAGLQELLDVVCDTPERRAEVFDGGKLKGHVVVLVNGLPADPTDGPAVRLQPGDTVAVFPFMGGG